MKNKGLFITTVIFFLLVNTTYYWEGKLELFAFPVFTLLAFVYLILALGLIRQVYFYIKEKLLNRSRLLLISLMTIVLVLTVYKPSGLINFDQLEGKDILVAGQEGAANCITTFKLKKNNKFNERSICFGIDEISGNYELKGDTIFFNNVKLGRNEKGYYKFAVIKRSDLQNKNIIGELVRYKDYNDTLTHGLLITKNELKEKME